jgi:hypothetical protein
VNCPERDADWKAQCRAHARRNVAGWEPLTEDQKQWLAPLWRPGVVAVWKAKHQREAVEREGASRAQ